MLKELSIDVDILLVDPETLSDEEVEEGPGLGLNITRT